jgi:hypothetical protein
MSTTPPAKSPYRHSLEFALSYAREFNWAVFPCVPKTDFPLAGSHGRLDATTNPGRLAELFRQPSMNIAVSATASGLVIVDVDVRGVGGATLTALERQHGSLPHTPRVLCRSGDGSVQYYLRDPAGIRFPAELGPGVQLKHRGSVLLPPSSIKGGAPHRWDPRARVRETALAPCPDWIVGRGSKGMMAQRDLGAATESFFGVAFSAAGLLGSELPDGRMAVRCPWAHEHTDACGLAQGFTAVLLPATSEGVRLHPSGPGEADRLALCPT